MFFSILSFSLFSTCSFSREVSCIVKNLSIMRFFLVCTKMNYKQLYTIQFSKKNVALILSTLTARQYFLQLNRTWSLSPNDIVRLSAVKCQRNKTVLLVPIRIIRIVRKPISYWDETLHLQELRVLKMFQLQK